MEKDEIQQDAVIAEQLGPPSDTPPPERMRTPRWIWAWVLSIVVLLFLYQARRILGPFIIAGVIAYIFSLVVDRIQARFRLPRWTIVTVLYLVVLGALGVGIYLGAETIIAQVKGFVGGGNNIIENGLRQVMGDTKISFGGDTYDAHAIAQKVQDAASGFMDQGPGGAIDVARELGARLLDALLVIVVSFYLLLNGGQVGKYLLKFVPADNRERTGYIAGRIHTALGAYLRGQLFLVVLMSLVSFLILQFVFQVPYALPLAILTGFLEILPLLGPAIAAVLAAGVALSAHGAGAAIGVIIAYTILRELEDQLVMPIVVGRAVELHPVVTIFAVLAGGTVAGALGMLLAVPAAAAIKVILDFLYPANPDDAMEQARPGLKIARQEAQSRGEEPEPLPASKT